MKKSKDQLEDEERLTRLVDDSSSDQISCGKWGQRPFRRIGRMPVRGTLISVEVNYYDGRDEDRVRINELVDGTFQLSGWPLANNGEKRPREKSFNLDPMTVERYRAQLSDMRLCPVVSQCNHLELIASMKIEFGGFPNKCCFSWSNGAPKQWTELETFAMELVHHFHEFCAK